MSLNSTDLAVGSSISISGVPSVVTALGGTPTTVASRPVPGGGSSGQVLTSLGNAAGADYETPSGGTGLSSATVTLTAAEIQDLVNTPKQLLAAPGANKFYRLVSADLAYIAGATPYTDQGNTRAFITLIDPAAVNATEFDIGNWFSQADSRLNQASVYNDNANGGNNADPLIDSVNKPLLLTAEGSGLIDGNGTAVLFLSYITLTVA